MACAFIFYHLLFPEHESNERDHHHDKNYGQHNDQNVHVFVVVARSLTERLDVAGLFADFALGVLRDCSNLLKEVLATDSFEANRNNGLVEIDTVEFRAIHSIKRALFENLARAGSKLCHTH